MGSSIVVTFKGSPYLVVFFFIFVYEQQTIYLTSPLESKGKMSRQPDIMTIKQRKTPED